MAKKASRIIHTHHDSLTGLMNRSGFESVLLNHWPALKPITCSIACCTSISISSMSSTTLWGIPGRRSAHSPSREAPENGSAGHGPYRDHSAASTAHCYRTVSKSGPHGRREDSHCIHELTVVSAQRPLDVSACIGIAQLNREADGIAGVMASAEIACKAAKEEGKDRIQIFQKDNTTLVRRSEEIEWIGRVQEALRDDLFVLYCQPVVPLLDSSAAAFRSADPPARLQRRHSVAVPVPAGCGALPAHAHDRSLGRASLAEALGAIWKTIAGGNPVFCINLSGQSFSNPGFQTFLMDEITKPACHRKISVLK